MGAFKIRGGLTYFDQLAQRGDLPREVISATRGNHGQSMGWAARAHGVACTIVVPRGNSVEKNAAMRALGVTLIEHGDDFQESREHAMHLADERGAHMVPSFHPDLLRGVSTYWWEFFRAVPQLDVVYVPIGQGSGACSAIAAKLALGHPVRIVGVVSGHATTYADSLAAGHVVEAPVTTQLADGMACRVADPEALAVMAPHLDHIVQVTDAEVAAGHARPVRRHPQRGRRRGRSGACGGDAGARPAPGLARRLGVDRWQRGRADVQRRAARVSAAPSRARPLQIQ